MPTAPAHGPAFPSADARDQPMPPSIGSILSGAVTVIPRTCPEAIAGRPADRPENGTRRPAELLEFQ